MPIGDLLQADGPRSRYFDYPDDQHIADSTALFARHMTALRAAYPRMPVDVVAHSMGGLVARAYIEGDDYAGGVDTSSCSPRPTAARTGRRAGSGWRCSEHYSHWRNDPDWKWSG